jgi:hypothetical protein
MQDLKTSTAINKACFAAAYGGSGLSVYADTETDKRLRVLHARTQKGVIKVLVLATGQEIVPIRVYTDL